MRCAPATVVLSAATRQATEPAVYFQTASRWREWPEASRQAQAAQATPRSQPSATGRTGTAGTAAVRDHAWARKVLGVLPGASEAAIRKKYHGMALTHHPDKCCAAGVGGDAEAKATARFQMIQQAYSVLRPCK